MTIIGIDEHGHRLIFDPDEHDWLPDDGREPDEDGDIAEAIEVATNRGYRINVIEEIED